VLKLLDRCIKEITSGFAVSLEGRTRELTTREWEVCNMIRNGLTSKEIARILHISAKGVDNHRNNIRSKTLSLRARLSRSSAGELFAILGLSTVNPGRCAESDGQPPQKKASGSILS
jgi:hypothetical protein